MAYSEVTTAGRSTLVLGQRQRRGTPKGESGTDFFCVSYDQAARQRHGVSHQSFYRGVAWRPLVGKRSQWRGRNFSFHHTDPAQIGDPLGSLDSLEMMRVLSFSLSI